MSERVNADQAQGEVSSDSGLLLSVEPLGGERLSAVGDDDGTDGVAGADTDAKDADGTDTADASDADGSDTISDADGSDASDADGTDLADNVESESGLGGENPLGINRERVKNGDDKDTGDT